MHDRRWWLVAAAACLTMLYASSAWAQGTAGRGSASGPTPDDEEDSTKNWRLKGSVETRIGQGTFVDLENDSGVEGEVQPNASAYDRVNMVYTFAPSYRWNDFTFGAELQLVHWLTAGGGFATIPAIGGATDAADVYFQDITLSGSWKGYTFDSVGLKLKPTLEVVLPTSRASQTTSKYFDATGSVALTKNFFDRVTFQAQMAFAKYFHRFKTPRVDADLVGGDNVLYRPGEAEDLGQGLYAIGGYNISHTFSFGGATQLKISDKVSASISYFFINLYSYPGPERDEFTSQYARPGTNLAQLISTGANVSYKYNSWLSFQGGVGSYMTPKTSDNRSFRFPFWNTQGGATNNSWLQLGVSASY